MFQLLYNIIQSTFLSLYFIIMTIITGKLPKISLYHFDSSFKGHNGFNICSDKFIKENIPSEVSNEAKHKIIEDFIFSLAKEEQFHNIMCDIEFPLFNGKEVYGTTYYTNTLLTINDNNLSN